MAAASGVNKKVIRKRETTYGVLAGASGATLMRRVKSDVSLTKDTFKSNEIRPDQQIADFRHGVRRVSGTISGELSPGAYSDEISSILRRDFAAVAAITGAGITIAAGSLVNGFQLYTITRSAGSWLTDGVKVGHVLQFSVGTFSANNLAKNVWVTAITSATALSVLVLNGTTLTAEGPITGSTVTVMGKCTFIPATGQTSVSYTLEHFYSDAGQSEVFTGIRYDKADINLPPTGPATLALAAMGMNLGQTGTVQYFTSPSSLSTNSITASVNGLVILNGSPVAIITGLSITIDPVLTGDPVVGVNYVPTQFLGPISVSGQLTMQFVDAVARDLFVNETETSLQVVLTSDNTANSQFIGITLPRVKLNGASKDDGTGAITQTMPFQALYNVNGGAGIATEQTTIYIQDSAAP